MTDFLTEIKILTTRWFKHLTRTPIMLFVTLLQPLIWMLLFANLFEKAAILPGFPADSYVQFIISGILALNALGFLAMAGICIFDDIQSGYIQRIMTAPISRSSIIISRFIYATVLTVVTSIILLAVGSLMGVSVAAGPAGFLGILFFVALFTIGVTAVSMIFAFLSKQQVVFLSITTLVQMPILFMSNALMPYDFMPSWIRTLAQINPASYLIDATRSLILDGWAWSTLSTALVALVVFDLLAVLIATLVRRRRLE